MKWKLIVLLLLVLFVFWEPMFSIYRRHTASIVERFAQLAGFSKANKDTTIKMINSTVSTSSRPASSRTQNQVCIDCDVSKLQHKDYKLVRDVYISEYGIRSLYYKHQKSGAQVISVLANDANKVFGITFRTPPADSTGVAHILEHSVLCGSRKFQTKEPFAELLKGSLNTFLNAFTYPDRTCYPVASQNPKDFYNLVDVYLDAVFFPRAVKDHRVLQVSNLSANVKTHV
jgi:hypothetical protein